MRVRPRVERDSAATIAAYHASRAVECNCRECREDAARVWGAHQQVDKSTLRGYLYSGLSAEESRFFPESVFSYGAEGLADAWDAAELLRSQPWAVRAEDMRVGFQYRGVAILMNGIGLDNCLVYVAPNWMGSISVVVAPDCETEPVPHGFLGAEDALYVASPYALVSGRVVAKKGTGKLVTKLSELPARLKAVLTHCKEKPGLVLEEDLVAGSGGFRSRLVGALLSGSRATVEARMNPSIRGEWGPQEIKNPAKKSFGTYEPGGAVVETAYMYATQVEGVFSYGGEAPPQPLPAVPQPPPAVPQPLPGAAQEEQLGLTQLLNSTQWLLTRKRGETRFGGTLKKSLEPTLLGRKLGELSGRQTQNIFPFDRSSATPITRVEEMYVERGGRRFWSDNLYVEAEEDTENGAKYVRFSLSPGGLDRGVRFATAHTCEGFKDTMRSGAVWLAPAKLFDACAKSLWKAHQIFCVSTGPNKPLLEYLGEEDVAAVLKLLRHSKKTSPYNYRRAPRPSFPDRNFGVGKDREGVVSIHSYLRARVPAECYSPIEVGGFAVGANPTNIDTLGNSRGSPFAGAEALVRTNPIPKESKVLWPSYISVI